MRCRFLPVVLLASVAFVSGCQPAPDFHTDTAGAHSWEQLQGNYVVVNYFAEWCAPCLRELPELNEFHEEYGDKVKLFGVSFDGLDNAALAKLREDYQIQFPLIQNEPLPALPFPQPNMLPATYVITPEGEVKGPLLGEQTISSLAAATKLEHE
ncbi:TlpA family protein disulfide reductase [Pseudidiomarina gelatinasegens]|jgi:thiol-disulfide isomerase/thioredoxin|uniref:TlpA family protein disulfide reductase n=1 Tax=Pseudidiomarina gelatinasegens TaxID=2487740 RepID=A0A451GEN2_9GAMM|nr:TlpA disulfide reductase family protein [Pseudidiomarina gelatinasegens]RWU11548.1 TlpA family protein disulfide reductase [Pseudidiomarina gelatinasegens]|tara:strand:+ start:1967 stop:2428 length:462 start_codon:yes stop_codon:yes gene_type:complete